MSKEAYEITKYVKETSAETLLNVRSGGVVEDLREEITQLRAKNKALRKDIKNHNYLVGQRDKLQIENEALRKWLHGDCKACKNKGLGNKSKTCQMCKMQYSYKWEFIEESKGD